MIVALESNGNVYLSLTQANSNSSIMSIYFHWLAKKLDLHKTGWRENTILLLDGASYHTSAATQDVLKKLRIPVMYLSPHSYDA